MIRTQIYIPEPVHQSAKILAGQRDETLAALLRRFIITGLQQEKRVVTAKNLQSLTKLNIKGGPKNLSSQMDKYLYQR